MRLRSTAPFSPLPQRLLIPLPQRLFFGHQLTTSLGIQTKRGLLGSFLVTSGGKSFKSKYCQVRLVRAGQSGLFISKSGTGSGTVTSSPEGITCGQDCSETYLQNTSVTLNAEADQFSYLHEWGSPCTGAGACSFSISANTTLPVSFGLRGGLQHE